MRGLLDDGERKRRLASLTGLALLCIVLWQTYWGSLLLYPFTILATWFHEMGHGIAAMLVGGQFDRLMIYQDGSGVARSLIPAESSGLADAFVS
ncbi:MAG TPA: M50 family metallopeptidase, partial [Croceibacterium sp.]